MRPTVGLIIDVDGTLIDSNGARAQAWAEAFAAQGHRVSYATLLESVGLVANDLLIRMIGLGLDTPHGQAIHTRYLEIFHTRLVPRIISFFHAERFVGRLISTGLKIAVASADPPDTLLSLLQTANAEELHHRDGARTAAPYSNRELVQAALARLGAAPPHVLMLTDAPYDTEAAAQLNIPSIALRTGGFPDASLSRAIAIYDDIGQLTRQLHNSPIAELFRSGQPISA